MVETALFTSAALVLLLGTLQIGALGFVQLSSDAAGFYDARAHVLTVATGSPEQATNTAFPQVPTAAMSPSVVPAPTPLIPVDYGYNDPNATTQSNSVYNRHGGASMLQPASEQVVVNDAPIMKILGQGLGASSIAAEPMWQECGTHFDVANVGCSLSSPPSDSQTNYFSDGEYTPPYLVGLNIVQQCEQSQPFGLYSGSANPDESDTKNDSNNRGGWNVGGCADGTNNGNSDVGFISMGTAEFLDTTNWSDSGSSGSSSNGAGISGPCDTTGVAAGGSGSGTAQTVFEVIAFHQRQYAILAQFFKNNPNQYTLESYSAQYDSQTNSKNQWESSPNSAVWSDYFTGAGPGSISKSGKAGTIAIPEDIVGTFASWEGFDDATHGPGGSGGDIYNAAVQTVYSWDEPISSGAPVSDPTYNNPTHPDMGCT